MRTVKYSVLYILLIYIYRYSIFFFSSTVSLYMCTMCVCVCECVFLHYCHFTFDLVCLLFICIYYLYIIFDGGIFHWLKEQANSPLYCVCVWRWWWPPILCNLYRHSCFISLLNKEVQEKGGWCEHNLYSFFFCLFILFIFPSFIFCFFLRFCSFWMVFYALVRNQFLSGSVFINILSASDGTMYGWGEITSTRIGFIDKWHATCKWKSLIVAKQTTISLWHAQRTFHCKWQPADTHSESIWLHKNQQKCAV